MTLRKHFRQCSIAATLCGLTISGSGATQVTQIPSPSESSDLSATTTAEASVLAPPPVSELAATNQIPEGLAASALADQTLGAPSEEGADCELDAELRTALESLPAASGLDDVCQFVNWQASGREHDEREQARAVMGEQAEAPSAPDADTSSSPVVAEGPPGVMIETIP